MLARRTFTALSRGMLGGSCRSAFFSTKTNSENQKKITKAAFTKITDAERKLLPGAKCMVSISVGQPAHTGSRIAATFNLVNKTFSACTFMLADTLQRHTMEIIRPHEPSENLMHQAKKNGDLWLCENMSLLSQLEIPWDVRRWNCWLNHNRFPSLLNKIQTTYQLEPEYRAAFDSNIDKYLRRVKNRGDLNTELESARNLCLKYLQEECAILCLWLEEGCQYDIYPGERAPAMQATYLRFIETIHPDLLKPLPIRFFKGLVESDELEVCSKSNFSPA